MTKKDPSSDKSVPQNGTNTKTSDVVAPKNTPDNGAAKIDPYVDWRNVTPNNCGSIAERKTLSDQLLADATALKLALSTTPTESDGKKEEADRVALQSLCAKLLLVDMELALNQKIEQDLWNIVYKQCITDLQSQIRDRSNSTRAQSQVKLRQVLDEADVFYRLLLHRLHAIYRVDLPPPASPLIKQVRPPPFKALPLNGYGDVTLQHRMTSTSYLYQHCLVHLGDVSRYNLHNDQASAYYLWAASVAPSCGHPYNQLAILEASKNHHLASVFYYARSLACATPFPAAASNLDKLFLRLTQDSLAPLPPLSPPMGTRGPGRKPRYNPHHINNPTETLTTAFLQFHSALYLFKDLCRAQLLSDLLAAHIPHNLSAFNWEEMVFLSSIHLYTLYTHLPDCKEIPTSMATVEGPALAKSLSPWIQCLLHATNSLIGALCEGVNMTVLAPSTTPPPPPVKSKTTEGQKPKKVNPGSSLCAVADALAGESHALSALLLLLLWYRLGIEKGFFKARPPPETKKGGPQQKSDEGDKKKSKEGESGVDISPPSGPSSGVHQTNLPSLPTCLVECLNWVQAAHPSDVGALRRGEAERSWQKEAEVIGLGALPEIDMLQGYLPLSMPNGEEGFSKSALPKSLPISTRRIHVLLALARSIARLQPGLLAWKGESARFGVGSNGAILCWTVGSQSATKGHSSINCPSESISPPPPTQDRLPGSYPLETDKSSNRLPGSYPLEPTNKSSDNKLPGSYPAHKSSAKHRQHESHYQARQFNKHAPYQYPGNRDRPDYPQNGPPSQHYNNNHPHQPGSGLPYHRTYKTSYPGGGQGQSTEKPRYASGGPTIPKSAPYKQQQQPTPSPSMASSAGGITTKPLNGMAPSRENKRKPINIQPSARKPHSSGSDVKETPRNGPESCFSHSLPTTSIPQYHHQHHHHQDPPAPITSKPTSTHQPGLILNADIARHLVHLGGPTPTSKMGPVPPVGPGMDELRMNGMEALFNQNRDQFQKDLPPRFAYRRYYGMEEVNPAAPTGGLPVHQGMRDQGTSSNSSSASLLHVGMWDASLMAPMTSATSTNLPLDVPLIHQAPLSSNSFHQAPLSSNSFHQTPLSGPSSGHNTLYHQSAAQPRKDIPPHESQHPFPQLSWFLPPQETSPLHQQPIPSSTADFSGFLTSSSMRPPMRLPTYPPETQRDPQASIMDSLQRRAANTGLHPSFNGQHRMMPPNPRDSGVPSTDPLSHHSELRQTSYDTPQHTFDMPIIDHWSTAAQQPPFPPPMPPPSFRTGQHQPIEHSAPEHNFGIW